MNRIRFAFRLALAGALAASLGLAACGRKGPLDPPPGASLEGEPQAHMPKLMNEKVRTPASTSTTTTTPAPKKTSPLDVLLN